VWTIACHQLRWITAEPLEIGLAPCLLLGAILVNKLVAVSHHYL